MICTAFGTNRHAGQYPPALGNNRGGSQTVSGIPTGNTCTVTEDALAPISGYTWGTPTFTPSSIVISTKGGTFEILCTTPSGAIGKYRVPAP